MHAGRGHEWRICDDDEVMGVASAHHCAEVLCRGYVEAVQRWHAALFEQGMEQGGLTGRGVSHSDREPTARKTKAHAAAVNAVCWRPLRFESTRLWRRESGVWVARLGVRCGAGKALEEWLKCGALV
jgi:hypothetical protein